MPWLNLLLISTLEHWPSKWSRMEWESIQSSKNWDGFCLKTTFSSPGVVLTKIFEKQGGNAEKVTNTKFLHKIYIYIRLQLHWLWIHWSFQQDTMRRLRISLRFWDIYPIFYTLFAGGGILSWQKSFSLHRRPLFGHRRRQYLDE